eukprot:EG_transcript_3149
MRVTIKTVAGRAFGVEAAAAEPVAALRRRIAEEHDYELEGLRLVASGVVLTDDMTVGDAHLDETNFVVMVAKKRQVRAKQEDQKQREKAKELEKEKEKELEQQAATQKGPPPPGPLTAAQLQGLAQLQTVLQTKARSLKEFSELLRFHGTVTELRLLIQKNQTLLAPILHQINYHAPQLLAAINTYPQEFLQIINEPVRRFSVESADELEGSISSAGGDHEVVYITAEEEEAIQRLCGLGFAYQTAAEAFIMCNRNEEVAAGYLFEMMEETAADGGPAGPAAADPTADGEGAPPTASSAPKTIADLVADGAVEAALLAVEALRSEGSACSAAPLPGLAEVRRAVSQAQCTVVYYGVLTPTSNIGAWVIAPDVSIPVGFQRLGPEAEDLQGGLVSLGRSLARSSGINPQSVWRRVLRQFHAALIAPLAALLPEADDAVLCFVPCPGPLAAVPFPALLDAGDAFLVEQHPVTTATSLRLLSEAGRPRARGEEPSMVLCAGDSTAELPLDIAVRRVSVGSFGPDAVHANDVVQVPSPEVASRLTASLAAGSAGPLPAQLVVVAGLEDGGGKRGAVAEEALQTAEAIIAAGIPSAIVPLWAPKESASKQSLEVLGSFYRHLTTTPHVARALRRAMMEAARRPETGIWDWAGWRLVGHAGEVCPVARPKQPAAPVKARRTTRHTADYRYLQQHRIPALYEKLVRELLERRPEDVPGYMLTFLEQRREEFEAMLASDPAPKP